jgi:hypothetical protein
MNLLGARASRSFGAEPDIKAWSDTVALNPARVTPESAADPAVSHAQGRLQTHASAALAGLAALSGIDPA